MIHYWQSLAMGLRRRWLPISFVGFSFLLSSALQAAPWIEPGEARTRHHLTTLVDAGVMSTPITSWPVMWSSVKNGLESIDPTDLTPQQLWSYQYLRHELRKAMAPISLGKRGHLSSKPTAISHFATRDREQYGSTAHLTFTGDRFAYRLQGQYVPNATDGHNQRADGSYISYLWGDWVLGGGALDRWWGPGWESSMILSHNARPAPALFIQRNSAAPFEAPVFSWLGPWQLTSFLAKLESNRQVPDAQLWGIRASIRPLSSLEFGWARTAIWGGEGQPRNLDAFGKLLLSPDEEQPASSMSAFDLRWGGQLMGAGVALYAQIAGTDEGLDLPSERTGLAGIEFSLMLGNLHSRTSIEARNSVADFYNSDRTVYNTAYEHPIYQSGYRFRNRPLGASTDNDSEALTVRSQWYFDHGRHWNISWSLLDLNTDGTNNPPPGGSVFGPDRTEVQKWSVQYTTPLNDNFKLSAGAFHFSETVPFQDLNIKSGAHLTLQAHW